MGKWSLPMWSSATLNEISQELRAGDKKAMPKMSDVSWTGSSRLCLFGSRWYIKKFQIFGYILTSIWPDLFGLTHPNCLCFELKSLRKITWSESALIILNNLELFSIWISIWAVNGSQNNLIPVLEFNFYCKSLVVGYDIEMFIFPFLVNNNAFFHQDGYATL